MRHKYSMARRMDRGTLSAIVGFLAMVAIGAFFGLLLYALTNGAH